MNNLKIRDKLIIIYFVCVFIPILLTNIIFYHVTTTNIKTQKTVDANYAITSLKGEIQGLIDDAAGIAYLYNIDSQLNTHLQRKYGGPVDYVESLSEIKNIFNRSEKEYQRIKSMKIYSTNPAVLSSAYISQMTDKEKKTSWYSDYIDTYHSFPYLYVENNQLSLIQKLNYFGNGQYDNTIKLDFNMDYLRELIHSTSFQGEIYIIDDKEKVIFGKYEVNPQKEVIYRQDLVIPEHPIEISSAFSNQRYLKNWTIYGVMDETQILQDIRKSGRFIVPLTIINFLIPSLIIILISRNIHGRLKNVLKHMKSVRGRNYKKIPFELHRDEIGQLSSEFNRMMERIDTLIDDVYIADIQKKDLELRQRQAQLHALHSQINPHFLFNALESIRMRSLMKGENETARTIQNMAIIFRKSISWNTSFVTVKEELELIESFLEIQKYRFGDKLQYNIMTDEKVLDAKIPKMTFLPFVENASIHGIENIVGIGLVTIQAAIYQQKIQFVIQDNGHGMSDEHLEELNRYLVEDTNIGNHVGMKNVMLRLKLYYGDQFTFHIHSLPQLGTTVTLTIPLQTDLNEQENK